MPFTIKIIITKNYNLSQFHFFDIIKLTNEKGDIILNKKIIIAIIIIIVLILLVFLFIRLGKNLENQPDQNMDEIETTEAIIEEDDLEIDIPEDYLSVEKDNITSSTSMKAYAVAYNYNEEKDLTFVNVYLKNNSNSNISKDAVAVI